MVGCTDCPHNCLVDRHRVRGVCGCDEEIAVSTVCVHRGEEPPLCGQKGIVNVFFAHCNLQCCFCQNYSISRRTTDEGLIRYRSIAAVADEIERLLPQTENIVGLVSPTHFVHLVPNLVDELHRRGLFPTIVYNTNGYDSVEQLRKLASWVDVYLPDYKFSIPELAKSLSMAVDYPQMALAALKEMHFQMGASLAIDDEGLAFRGLMIRHLVLPGFIENTLRCIDNIADTLSPRVNLSLMAQYTPPRDSSGALIGNLPTELSRPLSAEEYDVALNHCYERGFDHIWTQELTAAGCYMPDFTQTSSFER